MTDVQVTNVVGGSIQNELDVEEEVVEPGLRAGEAGCDGVVVVSLVRDDLTEAKLSCSNLTGSCVRREPDELCRKTCHILTDWIFWILLK